MDGDGLFNADEFDQIMHGAAKPGAATDDQPDRGLPLDAYAPVNPVGIHGQPDIIRSTEEADRVIAELKARGATNTLLISRYPDVEGLTDEERFTEDVKNATGVPPYIQIGNEPNIPEDWKDKQQGSPEQFGDWWARYANAVAAGGGYPGLPGLSPNATTPGVAAGEDSQNAYYERMLEHVNEKDPASLDRAWTAAHPYHVNDAKGASQDALDQLDALNEINRKLLGRSLPVVTTEGGTPPDRPAERRAEDGAQVRADMAREAQSKNRPWLLGGTADWILTGGNDPRWQGQELYNKDGVPNDIARRLENDRRKAEWEAARDRTRSNESAR